MTYDRRKAENKELREAVDVLKCFDTESARNYWIKVIDLTDAQKGYALVYANK